MSHAHLTITCPRGRLRELVEATIAACLTMPTEKYVAMLALARIDLPPGATPATGLFQKIGELRAAGVTAVTIDWSEDCVSCRRP